MDVEVQASEAGRLQYAKEWSGQHLNTMMSQVSFGLNPGAVLVLGLLREKNSDRTQQ